MTMGLYPLIYNTLIERALKEDLADAGDIATAAIVVADKCVKAQLVSRRAGRICGLAVAGAVFQRLDPAITITFAVNDGADVEQDTTLAVVCGSARAILSAERVALNLLARLSGIATAVRDVVQLIADTRADVVCTRKTTPGLRALEKYAVRVGGGRNHRFGLYDAVLIKDNHRVFVGSLSQAIERVRQQVGHLVKISVEVDTISELKEVLPLAVDSVLLDNMSLADLEQAVALSQGRVVTEASGTVVPDNIHRIAATGVDLISMGWLTHSVTALDVALDFMS